jgi:hypothetical protein
MPRRPLDPLTLPEIDVWRAANMLVRRHGTNAELEAARMVDAMLDRGDLGGRDVWRRIRRAELQQKPGGLLH